jgi:hypothetical protein
VLTDEEREPGPSDTVPVVEPAPVPAEPPPVRPITPAAVGVTLVGAGAVAGAVATWAATRACGARSAPRRTKPPKPARNDLISTA